MFRRFIITLNLALLPMVAYAADTDTLGPQSAQSSLNINQNAPINGTPSNDTAGLLQPANPQGLQSADAQSGGLQVAPSDSNLQSTAGTKNQSLSSLLGGDADGGRQKLTDSSAPASPRERLVWIGVGLIALCSFGAVTYDEMRRRQK